MKLLFPAPMALILSSALFAASGQAQPVMPGQDLPSSSDRQVVTPDYAVTPEQEAQGLPAGNYLSSCSDPHMVGDTLVASCDIGNSIWRAAALPQAMACDGAIDNVGGNLVCTVQEGFGSSLASPSPGRVGAMPEVRGGDIYPPSSDAGAPRRYQDVPAVQTEGPTIAPLYARPD